MGRYRKQGVSLALRQMHINAHRSTRTCARAHRLGGQVDAHRSAQAQRQGTQGLLAAPAAVTGRGKALLWIAGGTACQPQSSAARTQCGLGSCMTSAWDPMGSALTDLHSTLQHVGLQQALPGRPRDGPSGHQLSQQGVPGSGPAKVCTHAQQRLFRAADVSGGGGIP